MLGGASTPQSDPLSAIKATAINAISEKGRKLVNEVQLQEGESGVMFAVWLTAAGRWNMRVDTYGPTGNAVRKGLRIFDLTAEAEKFEIDPSVIFSAFGMSPEQAAAAAGVPTEEGQQFTEYQELKTEQPALPAATDNQE